MFHNLWQYITSEGKHAKNKTFKRSLFPQPKGKKAKIKCWIEECMYTTANMWAYNVHYTHIYIEMVISNIRRTSRTIIMFIIWIWNYINISSLTYNTSKTRNGIIQDWCRNRDQLNWFLSKISDLFFGTISKQPLIALIYFRAWTWLKVCGIRWYIYILKYKPNNVLESQILWMAILLFILRFEKPVLYICHYYSFLCYVERVMHYTSCEAYVYVQYTR